MYEPRNVIDRTKAGAWRIFRRHTLGTITAILLVVGVLGDLSFGWDLMVSVPAWVRENWRDGLPLVLALLAIATFVLTSYRVGRRMDEEKAERESQTAAIETARREGLSAAVSSIRMDIGSDIRKQIGTLSVEQNSLALKYALASQAVTCATRRLELIEFIRDLETRASEIERRYARVCEYAEKAEPLELAVNGLHYLTKNLRDQEAALSLATGEAPPPEPSLEAIQAHAPAHQDYWPAGNRRDLWRRADLDRRSIEGRTTRILDQLKAEYVEIKKRTPKG